MTGDWTESAWRTQASIPPEEKHPETSRRIADFELVKGLGRGEFAEVYLCRRAGQPGSALAAKRINKARVYADADIRKRIRSIKRINSEIEAMRALDHPAICTLEATYHTPKYVYLVMEKGGRDLYDALTAEHASFGVGVVLRVAYAVAGALGHCAARGVVHRDLKPENVLLAGDVAAGDVVVKVCDFGLCGRAKDGSWAMSDFVGSPGFFAPEILFDDLYHAEKVDVWSLGCVVLEMVEGHEGFEHGWLNRCYSSGLLYSAARFHDALHETVGALHARPTLQDPSIKALVGALLVIDVERRVAPTALADVPVFDAVRRSTVKAPAPSPAQSPEGGFFGLADRASDERRAPFDKTPTIKGRTHHPAGSSSDALPAIGAARSTQGSAASLLSLAPKLDGDFDEGTARTHASRDDGKLDESVDDSPNSVHSPIAATPAKPRKPHSPEEKDFHIPPFRGVGARSVVDPNDRSDRGPAR